MLTKNSVAIQTVVADASTIVESVAPSLTPLITEFDALEEAIMGKIAAAAADVANAPSLSALFGEIWPGVQSLVAALKNHPTVSSVTAALGTAQKAG